MTFRPLFYLLCFSIFSFPLHANSIALISMDANEQEKIVKVDARQLVQDFSTLYNSIETSVVEKLTSEQGPSPLHLRGVSIGLGMSGDIGIGPFQYGASVKQRLSFNKVKQGK